MYFALICAFGIFHANLCFLCYILFFVSEYYSDESSLYSRRIISAAFHSPLHPSLPLPSMGRSGGGSFPSFLLRKWHPYTLCESILPYTCLCRHKEAYSCLFWHKNDEKSANLIFFCKKIWSCQKNVVPLQPFCVCSAREREKIIIINRKTGRWIT